MGEHKKLSFLDKKFKKNNPINVLVIHRKNPFAYDLIEFFYERKIPTCFQGESFDLDITQNLFPLFDFIIAQKPLELELVSSCEDLYLYKSSGLIKNISLGSWFFFTSGSTGSKKLIAVDRETMNYRINQDQDLLGLDKNSRFLNYLNLDHELGIYSFLTSKQFSEEQFLENIISEANFFDSLKTNRITHLISTPFIWEKILNTNLKNELKDLNELNAITISGGELSDHNMKKLEKLLPIKTKIIKTYGQTESSRSLVCILSEGEKGYRPISDEAKIELASTGELIHAGMGKMLGEIELKTGKLIESEVIHTGDFFEKHPGGLKYIGRKDRLISYQDKRIHLDEIEKFFKDKSFEVSLTHFNGKLFGFYESNENSVKLKSIYEDKIIFKYLEKIPRTSLGKVDYNSLNVIIKEMKLSE